MVVVVIHILVINIAIAIGIKKSQGILELYVFQLQIIHYLINFTCLENQFTQNHMSYLSVDFYLYYKT
jgi:multidrug transporter EmrE-like cation transporter